MLAGHTYFEWAMLGPPCPINTMVSILMLASSMQGSWKWVNEAKQGSKQPKWGYTSSAVGDALTLRVTRRRAAAPLLGFGGGNSSVLVGLGVLRSYKGMGAAAVACAQGCNCSPQVFELQHKQQVGEVYKLANMTALSHHAAGSRQLPLAVLVDHAQCQQAIQCACYNEDSDKPLLHAVASVGCLCETDACAGVSGVLGVSAGQPAVQGRLPRDCHSSGERRQGERRHQSEGELPQSVSAP